MKNVTAYVHSHWDREWYREFEEFRLRLIEVFNEIIIALKNNELPCFYFDGQTAAIEDYLQIHPEKLSIIKELIKQKKLRIGPFYCSADSFLVSGECLYRNFEMGIKKSKELGENEFIAYLSDTFGHSSNIPYILKANNITRACMWRGLGDLPADINWNGIDVTYLLQGYFQDFLNKDWSIDKKAQHLKNYLDKISKKSGENVMLPIGADHLAIPKQLSHQIKELNKIYKDYKINLSTPFEYFNKIKHRTKVNGEFLNNDLNFILPGVYSTRIPLKQTNAHSQWLLARIAEPIQAISKFFYNTSDFQNEIDYAYKTLIKNHAHDSIYGCSTDDVNNEVMQRFKKVNAVSNGIIKRTLRNLSDKNGELSVINLSNFNYSGKIFIETDNKLPKYMNAVKISSKKGFADSKLYNINDIPITEDITSINTYLIDVKDLPPFSIKKINEKNICGENNLKYSDNYIENSNIKLSVENGFVNVTDKKNKTVYKNFIKFTDRADIGDSYNFGALKGDIPVNAKLISCKIKEVNYIRCILSLRYIIEIPLKSNEKGRSKKVNKCRINLNAILYNQAETLELQTEWINKSENHILQIGFNLKEKITKTVSEDLYTTVEREFNPDYDIYKEIPAPRGKELKPNTAPMQRFVAAQGVMAATKGNCEYEINKNTLYITLLRSTGIISNPNNPTRGTPAGPPMQTPDMQCIGTNSFNCAIGFTNDIRTMYQYTEEFYSPYLALFTDLEDKTFIKTHENSLVYALKTVDDGIMVREIDRYKDFIKNTVKRH